MYFGFVREYGQKNLWEKSAQTRVADASRYIIQRI